MSASRLSVWATRVKALKRSVMVISNFFILRKSRLLYKDKLFSKIYQGDRGKDSNQVSSFLLSPASKWGLSSLSPEHRPRNPGIFPPRRRQKNMNAVDDARYISICFCLPLQPDSESCGLSERSMDSLLSYRV